MSASSPLLRCAHVSFAYDGGRRMALESSGRRLALDDVSFDLERGRCLALVGESGSGKSTLTRLLLGLERPIAGRVELDGRLVWSIPARVRARLVQPVFQDPGSALNPALSVRRNLLLPLVIHRGVDSPDAETVLREALERVGLDARHLDERPTDLSGGQVQRIALARALMLRPALLLLDEPTASLDVSVQALILRLLAELRRELALGFVFVSHNLPVVAALADEIAVLQGGRIVERGAAHALLSNPQHPHSISLLQSCLSLPRRLRDTSSSSRGLAPGAAH